MYRTILKCGNLVQRKKIYWQLLLFEYEYRKGMFCKKTYFDTKIIKNFLAVAEALHPHHLLWCFYSFALVTIIV